MSFSGIPIYSPLPGVQRCYASVVRPSDQNIITGCFNNDFKNHLLVLAINGSVINRGFFKTTGGASSDYIYGVSVDPLTGDIYAAGRGLGTFAGQPAAYSGGQFMTAKVFANWTTAWVRLQGPQSIGYAYANSVTYNQASESVFVAGVTTAAYNGFIYRGGGSDAVVAAYMSNGSYLWTKLEGTTSSEFGYSIVNHQKGAIVAGQWQSNNAYIEQYQLDGSVGWFQSQTTSTCQAQYQALYFNQSDSFVYAFGQGYCVNDGSPAATVDMLVVRHFASTGLRDATFQSIIPFATFGDAAYAGVVDYANKRIGVGGYFGGSRMEYASLNMDGTLIRMDIDITQPSFVEGMTVTNAGVIVFTGHYGGLAFMGVDTGTYVTKTTTTTTLASTTTTTSLIGSKLTPTTTTTSPTNTAFTTSTITTSITRMPASSTRVSTSTSSYGVTASTISITHQSQTSYSFSATSSSMLTGNFSLAGITTLTPRSQVAPQVVSSRVSQILRLQKSSETQFQQSLATFQPLSFVDVDGKLYSMTGAATITESKSNNQGQIDGQKLPQLLIAMVIGVAVLLLLFVFGIMFWYCRKQNKRIRVNNAFSTDTQNVTFTEMQRAFIQQTETGNSTTSTAVVTSHELSIPLFLLCDSSVDFKMLRQIASGSQGTVCMVHICSGSQLVERAAGSQVVGKFAKAPVSMLNARMRDAFYQEVSLYWMFRDTAGFARVFGYAELPVATILMEFCPLGALDSYIQANVGNQAVNQYAYSKWQVFSLFKDCTRAFQSMHEKGVVHCDIKPANVLVKQSPSGHLQAVIADFGVARLLSSRKVMVQEFQESKLNGLSLVFAAPEALTRLRTRIPNTDPRMWTASDVFSTSMLLKEMLTRQGPWQ